MIVTEKIAEYRKAIAALIGPPVVIAAGYIANGVALEDFGSTEWFFVIAAGLGVGGLVAAVPNGGVASVNSDEAGEVEADEDDVPLEDDTDFVALNEAQEFEPEAKH